MDSGRVPHSRYTLQYCKYICITITRGPRGAVSQAVRAGRDATGTRTADSRRNCVPERGGHATLQQVNLTSDFTITSYGTHTQEVKTRVKITCKFSPSCSSHSPQPHTKYLVYECARWRTRKCPVESTIMPGAHHGARLPHSLPQWRPPPRRTHYATALTVLWGVVHPAVVALSRQAHGSAEGLPAHCARLSRLRS